MEVMKKIFAGLQLRRFITTQCIRRLDSQTYVNLGIRNSVIGDVRVRTAHRYGRPTTARSIYMDDALRRLVSPVMRSLKDVQNKSGIDSLNWGATRDLFDSCIDLHLLSSGKDSPIELSSRSYRRSRNNTEGDVTERLQKIIHDDDVLSDLSFNLRAVTESLTSPLVEDLCGISSTPGATVRGQGVKLWRESPFLNLSVLLYIDTDRPYVKISRLYLVVCAEFKREGKHPVSWHVNGVYNSCTYVPGPDFLATFRNEAERLGQEETLDLIGQRQ